MFIKIYTLILFVLILLIKVKSCPDDCQCWNDVVDCSNLLLYTEPVFYNSTQIINLTNNQLTTIHKESYQHLAYLKELYLSINDINLIENEAFDHVNDLEYLDLSSNKLDKLVCSIFSTENKLVFLDISKNNILEIDCNDYLFKRLNFLNISHNKLVEFPFHLFLNGFKALTKLDLSYNFFTSLTLFYSMEYIDWINLQNNKITKFETSKITNFQSLKYLNMANNYLKNLNSYAFQNMPNLEILILNDNPLSHITDGTFLNLNNLKYLNLDSLLITSIDNKTFEGLYSLTNLSISNNYLLKKIDSNSFKNTKTLLSLVISNNSLIYFDEKLLYDLPSLNNLNISKNKFVCDCRLKRTMFYLKDLKEKARLTIDDIKCSYPLWMNGVSAFSAEYLNSKCSKLTQTIGELDKDALAIDEISALICSAVVIPCTALEIIPSDNFYWFKRGKDDKIYQYSTDNLDSKHIVSENGSLQIMKINRSDIGYYYCLSISKKLNHSSIILLTMDVEFMRIIELISLFWALMSVVFFFCIAIGVAVIRMCLNLCSKKERTKKKKVPTATLR